MAGTSKAAEGRDKQGSGSTVHIVTGVSFGGTMKLALQQLGWLETHKLIVLHDDYGIGPLAGLDTAAGRRARAHWLRDRVPYIMEEQGRLEKDFQRLAAQLASIPDSAEVMIWSGGNAPEQLGMRFAIDRLCNRNGRSLHLASYDPCAICEQRFNRPHLTMKYKHAGEITPEKLQQALLHADGSGRLFPVQIERLQQEWQALAGDSNRLRIWQQGAIVPVPEDYYDAYLLEQLDKLAYCAEAEGFVRASRLIGHAAGFCRQNLGDYFYLYRLRELIKSGMVVYKGEVSEMRLFSVKRSPAGH